MAKFLEVLAVIVTLSPLFLMGMYPLYLLEKHEREVKKQREDLIRKLNGDE